MIWYDKAAMLRVNTVEFFSKNYHENRVYFPEERSVFVFDHQHSRRHVQTSNCPFEKSNLHFFSAKHLPRLLFASKVENYAATDGIVNAFFFKLERQSCQNEC